MNLLGLGIFITIILLVSSVVMFLKIHKLNRKIQHKFEQKITETHLPEEASAKEKEPDIHISEPPILNIPKPAIFLASDKEINYSKLQHLLENLEWKKADAETRVILQQISSINNFSYLDAQSIAQLSCTDLQTIDNLWLYYSNCHFGLTVQHQLWQASEQDINLFGEWVGWCKQGIFIRELDLIYDLSAPAGHLPVAYLPIVGDCLWMVLDSVTWLNQRLQDCQKQENI